MINQLISQRYEVLEKVGESKLFVVYKARDKVTNRIVALKLLAPPYASDPALFQGLRNAAPGIANLDQPNITRLQEMGEHDGQPYLVVEFVRGINLKERIRRIAPFTLSVAVDIAVAIAEALHYAHNLQQAHGDLRPQNIIISPEGAVKVTDFGIQRAVLGSPAAQRDLLERSAPYHAPEGSIAQPGSPSGDLYALGAMLYEMLTGTPVYAGDTPEAIADQHAFAEIPSPRALNPGVPRSIEGILVKCLQKRPAQRYANAAELLNDLKSVRDALRFGKPLSWSPIDVETMRVAPERPVTPVAAASAPAPRRAPAPATPVMEPVADVAASSQTIPMPQRNALRAQDERVSIVLKAAVAAVTIIIVFCLFGFAAVWVSHWSPPKPVMLPSLTGKSIEEARKTAEELKLRLIEHGEFSEKPRNIVYKTDQQPGAQIRPNHVINVWYSKGSKFVNVPSVKGMQREEAEQKLKDAGLTVGNITQEHSDSVPYNAVVRQADKQRVQYDTPIDLVISQGPKERPNEGSATTEGDPNDSTNPPNVADTPKTCTRTLIIERDGKGVRRVRIEFEDERGPHPPILDEYRDEGDKIPITFDYYGKNVTLLLYYDDQMKTKFTFDPQEAANKSIRGQQ